MSDPSHIHYINRTSDLDSQSSGGNAKSANCFMIIQSSVNQKSIFVSHQRLGPSFALCILVSSVNAIVLALTLDV